MGSSMTEVKGVYNLNGLHSNKSNMWILFPPNLFGSASFIAMLCGVFCYYIFRLGAEVCITYISIQYRFDSLPVKATVGAII